MPRKIECGLAFYRSGFVTMRTVKSDKRGIVILTGRIVTMFQYLGGVEKSAQPFLSLNLVKVATTTITITAGYFGWLGWR
jgi:hypothetical protein